MARPGLTYMKLETIISFRVPWRLENLVLALLYKT